MRFCVCCLLLLSAILMGCSRSVRQPDLGGLYDRSAMHHGTGRNPVIVIPGILGSRLRDEASGAVVWGAFSGGYANPQTEEGALLTSLPMRPSAALADLTDGVEPDGVLDRVRVDVLFLPVELNAYVNILGTLGAGGYRDQMLGESGAVDYGDNHYTCFQFAYDWRRDIVESAKKLHEFILERRAYVQNQIRQRDGVEDADVKFDIVAHSMGGLVARYYLMYGDADLPADGTLPPVTWAGAKHVNRVIMIGTPNAGSVLAVKELVEGEQFAPILPKYEPALLGTMPSIYQLLPRPRHKAVVDIRDPDAAVDILDPAVWERLEWGLADPAQDKVLRKLLPEVSDADERRAIALDHQRKCLDRARQFFEAMDVEATPPDDLEYFLIAGDADATSSAIAVNQATGKLRAFAAAPGDGTVLRSSALLDERVGGEWSPRVISPIAWRHVTFLFTDHLGLTADPAFSDNVLFLLLEAARPSRRERGAIASSGPFPSESPMTE